VKYTSFGATDDQVSRLALGTLMMGSWGNSDQDECRRHSCWPRAERGRPGPESRTTIWDRRAQISRKLLSQRSKGMCDGV
jgi:hypothetical protein